VYSPTRSSFISGRLPIHVHILNTDPASFNVSSGERAGVATVMIGEVLARGGYTTGEHIKLRARLIDVSTQFGRIVALHHRSSTLYQIREHILCLYF
jgi:arylsulfatase A-like enzyme